MNDRYYAQVVNKLSIVMIYSLTTGGREDGGVGRIRSWSLFYSAFIIIEKKKY